MSRKGGLRPWYKGVGAHRPAGGNVLGMGFRFSAGVVLRLVLAAAMLAGCAASGAGSFGRLRLSTSATAAFESARVLPDHHYYYTGSDNNPNAIIAIQPQYTLETRFWKPVEATPKQLRNWVDRLTDLRGYGLKTLGSDIVGPQGEYIGIWYSKKADTTTVRLLEDNRVMVYPPAEQQNIRRWPWERMRLE